jgi:hypothetical protein
MSISYRHLSRDKAFLELDSVKLGQVDVLEAISREDFHSRPFADSGITTHRLLEARTLFLEAIGASSGNLGDISVQPGEFDRLFTRLSQTLFYDMSPIDGFSAEVWSYINLRLLPDLAVWRWLKKGPEGEVTDERLLGGSERSCFQRLWLRAYVLGGDLASQLQEDEAVNIFERPEALGGNRRLSIAMATYIVNNRGVIDSNSGKGIISTEIVKQSAKRLRRAMSVQVVQTMSESELQAHINDTFQETLKINIEQKSTKTRLRKGPANL